MLQLPESLDFQAVNILLEKFRGVGEHDLPEVVTDRKSTRLNSSHSQQSRMPSSA